MEATDDSVQVKGKKVRVNTEKDEFEITDEVRLQMEGMFWISSDHLLIKRYSRKGERLFLVAGKVKGCYRGQNFSADSLIYNEADGIFQARGKIWYNFEKYVLTSDILTYNLKNSLIKLLSNTGGFIEISLLPSKNGVQASIGNNICKSFKSHNPSIKKREAYLIAQKAIVKLKHSIKVSGFPKFYNLIVGYEGRADTMTLFFDRESKTNLKQLVAEGQFMFQDKLRISKGDRAVFNFDKNNLLITGNVVTESQGKGKIYTNEMLIDMNEDNQIKVNSASEFKIISN